MKITHEVQITNSSGPDDGFYNSRMALKTLLEGHGHNIAELKVDLALENFQNLIHFPEYLTSLSHTRGAGAAVLAHKNNFLSLGIDIEWSDRIFKPEAQRFFRNPLDSPYENSLELWTMKEAAFKALSPLGHSGVLVLSKIIIQEGNFWTLEDPLKKGLVHSSIMLIDSRTLYVSIAQVTRNKSRLIE